MNSDIRTMDVDEATLVMNKCLKLANDINLGITFDKYYKNWLVVMEMKDGSKMIGNGMGDINHGVTETLRIEYTPPKSGNVRFDLVLSKQSVDSEIIRDKFNELLLKFGSKGKNVVAEFEDLDKWKDQNRAFPAEYINAHITTKRTTSQKIGLWFLRISNNQL